MFGGFLLKVAGLYYVLTLCLADENCFQIRNWQETKYDYEELICSTSIKDIPPWHAFENKFSSDQGKPLVMNINCTQGFLSNVDHSFTIMLYRDHWKGTVDAERLNLGVYFAYTNPDTSLLYYVKKISVKPITTRGIVSSIHLSRTYPANPVQPLISSISGDDKKVKGKFFAAEYSNSRNRNWMFDEKTDAYMDIYVIKRGYVKPVECGHAAGYANNTSTISTSVPVDINRSSVETAKYFLSSTLSDVEVRARDVPAGEGFPAHRFVLASKTNCEGTNCQSIDCSVVCVTEFLRFIYTGKATLSNELCRAGRKYEVEDLQKVCNLHSLDTEDDSAITTENVLEKYEMAVIEGNEERMQDVKKFIFSKKTHYLGNPEALKTLSLKYPDVALELLRL